MTKADAARLVAIVVTAYPNFDKFKDAKAIEATVNLWAMMFEQDESGIVALAVKKHIATNKWPPSVAQIREIMLEIQHPELIEPDKAWLAVSDLMYSAGQFNHGDLSRQLPPLVARAVESIGWTSLWEMHRSAYIGGKPGMDRVAFMQQYTPMYEREKSRNMTPAQLTEKIDNAAGSLPDKGQRLIEYRESERRRKEQEMEAITRGALRLESRIVEQTKLELRGEVLG